MEVTKIASFFYMVVTYTNPVIKKFFLPIVIFILLSICIISIIMGDPFDQIKLKTNS